MNPASAALHRFGNSLDCTFRDLSARCWEVHEVIAAKPRGKCMKAIAAKPRGKRMKAIAAKSRGKHEAIAGSNKDVPAPSPTFLV